MLLQAHNVWYRVLNIKVPTMSCTEFKPWSLLNVDSVKNIPILLNIFFCLRKLSIMSSICQNFYPDINTYREYIIYFLHILEPPSSLSLFPVLNLLLRWCPLHCGISISRVFLFNILQLYIKSSHKYPH